MKHRLVSLSNWARKRLPTREGLEKNRYLAPFAHLVLRADLWRFNRRSVPRGVALGLFTGIFIPFAHSFIAAMTAVFVRANVPVAIVSTWTSNPVTWTVMFPAAFWISTQLGFHADMATFRALVEHEASMGQWAHWLVSSAAPALLAGLFVLAVVVASLGYLVAVLVWRLMVARKRSRPFASGRRGMKAG